MNRISRRTGLSFGTVLALIVACVVDRPVPNGQRPVDSTALPPAGPNDYYNDQEAREAVEAIINAYGGRDRIRAIDRVALRFEYRMHGIPVEFQFYISPDAVRRDISLRDSSIVHGYDGEQAWMIVAGEPLPGPPALETELEKLLRRGAFQNALLAKLCGPDQFVNYRGPTAYDDAEYIRIDTRDERGRTVEHYYDPETWLERLSVTRVPDGPDEIRRIIEYGSFRGVKYARLARSYAADADKPIGEMRVLDVSHQFEESLLESPL